MSTAKGGAVVGDLGDMCGKLCDRMTDGRGTIKRDLRIFYPFIRRFEARLSNAESQHGPAIRRHHGWTTVDPGRIGGDPRKTLSN